MKHWALWLILAAAGGLQAADTPLQVWAKSLAKASQLAAAGDERGAEKAYQTAVQAGEALSAQPERLGLALNNLGSFYIRTGRLDDAEQALERAVRILEEARGPESDQALDARFNLGALYFKADKMAKAGDEFERVLKGRMGGSKEQRAKLAKAELYLAQIYQSDGQNDRAHRYYMGALRVFDEDRQANQREFDMAFGMAAAMLDDKIRFNRVRRDDGSLRATLIFLDRAMDLHATYGDGIVGEHLARQSIDARRQLMGDKSPAAWRGLMFLARALTAQKRFDEAMQTLEEALDLIRGEDGLGALAEGPVLEELAKVGTKKGDPVALEKAHWRLIEIRREAFGAEHGRLQERFDAAIEAVRAMGDDAAVQRFVAAKAESPPGPWDQVGFSSSFARKPTIQKSSPPEYPVGARTRAYEGSVRIEALIDENGDVADVHVAECAGHGLDKAALNAVKKWKFVPGKINGRPLPTVVPVDINFNLRTER